MAWREKLACLQDWAIKHRGSIDPAIAVEYTDSAGVHFRATKSLTPGMNLCSTPHTLALSSLNALVDDTFPVFRTRGLAVEAIGYFYLMHQYLIRENSFWWPYVDTLPSPHSPPGTPFIFDDEDMRWLVGTDVCYTIEARKALYRQHYENGIRMLKQKHIDITLYTWDLFRWAVAMYTSRSFSSLALRPQDTKYWTTYKQAHGGTRQTVLVDMSRTSAEDLDFPVLLPLLDLPNHSPEAKIDLVYDPGRSGLRSQDAYDTGHEVLNNYGPKGNDELLLGYGFCLENNPHDKVLLTLKKPSAALQHELRRVHPGYFTTDGEWNREKSTFGLHRLEFDSKAPSDIFLHLPEALLELLFYILRDERRLPFAFVEEPTVHLLARDENSGRHYLPFITRMIAQSLLPKLAHLRATSPTDPPSNEQQRHASIYRQGQIDILESVTGSLRKYLCSLRWSPSPSPDRGPTGCSSYLLTLEELAALFAQRARGAQVDAFWEGLESLTGTHDVAELRAAGWEEDVYVLLLCYVRLSGALPVSRPETVVSEDVRRLDPDDDMHHASGLLDLVRNAGVALPGTLWQDDRWNETFIVQGGGLMLRDDSFMMMVEAGTGVEEPRLVVYMAL